MSFLEHVKGKLFTIVKKSMTKKLYTIYYRENKEVAQQKKEYEENLLQAYKHLDACKFKNKGWPCPTCPDCCFHGKDYENMMNVVKFAEKRNLERK